MQVFDQNVDFRKDITITTSINTNNRKYRKSGNHGREDLVKFDTNLGQMSVLNRSLHQVSPLNVELDSNVRVINNFRVKNNFSTKIKKKKMTIDPNANELRTAGTKVY